MLVDFSFDDVRAKAEHIKALGWTEVYVSKGKPPWHLATRCEPGGTHRIDIATSVWFYGHDPETGINLRWSFDIEPRAANGSGSYQVDARACRRVLSAIPGECRDAFRAYLAGCAIKVRAKGQEYQDAASRPLRDATVLDELARSKGED